MNDKIAIIFETSLKFKTFFLLNFIFSCKKGKQLLRNHHIVTKPLFLFKLVIHGNNY